MGPRMVCCLHPQGDCSASAKPTVIQITDTCTTCAPAQLNIHYMAFKQYIADPALGTVGVQYRQVHTT
jgi:hypothetical protein